MQLHEPSSSSLFQQDALHTLQFSFLMLLNEINGRNLLIDIYIETVQMRPPSYCSIIFAHLLLSGFQINKTNIAFILSNLQASVI